MISPAKQVSIMNLTNLWAELKSQFWQGLTWVGYYLKDNPAYAVALVVLVIVLWLLLKSEVRHK